MTASAGCSFFRLPALFALGFSSLALGQSNPVQVNFNVSAVGGGFGCCESIAGDSTTATVFPGVSANLHIAGGAYSDGGGTGGWTFTFVFPNGDQAVFNDQNSSLEGNAAIGNAALTFGSGMFLLARGNLNYTLACTDCGNDITGPIPFTFSFNGPGVLTFPAGTTLPGQAPSPPAAQCSAPADSTCGYDTHGNFLVRFWQTVKGNKVLSPQTQAGQGGSVQIRPVALPYPATYTVSAKCVDLSGTCWVSAAASGTVNPFTVPTINAVINIPSLTAGTYPANVTIIETPTDSRYPAVMVNVPMTLIVSAAGPGLALSTTGMQFQTVAGGSAPTITQSVAVSNSQTGTLSFQAAASTLTGGSWLSVSASEGNVTTIPENVRISANPAGLAPGVYSGRVDFSADGAFYSPQSVLVSLTVLPAPTLSTPAIPATTPAGLLFVSTPKLAPAPQNIQLASASSRTVTVTPQAIYQQGSNWLTAASSSNSLTAGIPITQTVSVNPAGLPPGVYRATLSENVAETSSNYPVNVVLVVASANCAPKQLVPVLGSPGNRFQVTAGLPLTVQAQVVDDCGNPMESGSVNAYFAGDPPASLTHAGNGIWQGTWLPHGLGGGAASVSLNAATLTPPLAGSQSVTGTVIANPSITAITPGGVVSAASFAANAPLAPGSYISIFGSNLTSGTNTATVPYPAILGGTKVFLNGQALPLVFAAAGQVNAVVPYDAAINTTAQLIVQNGSRYSMPEQVTLAAAQPAIFSQDSSGTGAAVIVVVKADGRQFVATPVTPASAGDALVIYCTGLGAEDTTIAAGLPSPIPPAHTLGQPIVTVGGQSASVLFSGLTPGFFGLYQVNAIMPAGVAKGSSVPVSITIGGATSPALTLAVQ